MPVIRQMTKTVIMLISNGSKEGSNLAMAVEHDSVIRGLADETSAAQKLRILFLIDEIGAITEGGTERQVLQLVQLARRLGYDPRLAVLRGTEWLHEEQAGCPIYLTRADSLLRLSGWRSCVGLMRWMRRERVAVIQTFFVECNILGPWLGRLAGVAVVIGSRRNLNQWHGRAKWVEQLICWLQRLSNLSADCIVGNSEVVVNAMVTTERIPREKMRVAYNGIDLRKFSGLELQRSRARQMLGVAEDEVLVGNISCMRPVKGLCQFVDAAHIVLKKAPGMRFLIVGDGSEMEAVTERIQLHGIADRIHLAGAQTDVLPYLAAMDIGVLSSLAEGFSNSLLEYMAAGLASVATDVGGNREALQETGILVPADDSATLAEAILQLRSVPMRRKMGVAARERVEQFSLERAERRMEEIYTEMLHSKKIPQRKN